MPTSFSQFQPRTPLSEASYLFYSGILLEVREINKSSYFSLKKIPSSFKIIFCIPHSFPRNIFISLKGSLFISLFLSQEKHENFIIMFPSDLFKELFTIFLNCFLCFSFLLPSSHHPSRLLFFHVARHVTHLPRCVVSFTQNFS